MLYCHHCYINQWIVVLHSIGNVLLIVVHDVGIRQILLLCTAQTHIVPPSDAALPDVNTLHRITFLRMLLQPHHDSYIHWPAAKLQMQPVSSFYGIFHVSILHLHYPAAPAPNPFTSLSAISLKYASVGIRSGA